MLTYSDASDTRKKVVGVLTFSAMQRRSMGRIV